jgi:hypothetical protein
MFVISNGSGHRIGPDSKGQDMTTISSGFSAQAAMQSPRARMNARLEAATQAGTISKTDETALSGALDDIDKALSSSSASGTASATRPDPSAMKTRIDGLIDQEVKDGKLTDDQAAELKDLFGANAPDQAQGPGGPGGPGAAGGPPPPPPSGSDDDDDSVSATGATDSISTKLDALTALIEKLRQSLASDDSYGASASSTSSQTALLIDKTA